MRLKQLKNQKRVFMNPQDYETILGCADSRRAEVAMRCMGEMGLRVSEVGFKMQEIRESTHEDVDILFLPVYGKDTTGESENGKRRDVWLPSDLKERLDMYVKNENISEHIPILPVSSKTISRDIKASAQNAAKKTGNTDFEYVTCHDFRAYFATNMLLREQVDVEIVMEIGGWADRQNMEPYIDASFDDIIQSGLVRAGLLSGDIDSEPTEHEQLMKKLEDMRAAIEEIDPTAVSGEKPGNQAGILDF